MTTGDRETALARELFNRMRGDPMGLMDSNWRTTHKRKAVWAKQTARWLLSAEFETWKRQHE